MTDLPPTLAAIVEGALRRAKYGREQDFLSETWQLLHGTPCGPWLPNPRLRGIRTTID